MLCGWSGGQAAATNPTSSLSRSLRSRRPSHSSWMMRRSSCSRRTSLQQVKWWLEAALYNIDSIQRATVLAMKKDVTHPVNTVAHRWALLTSSRGRELGPWRVGREQVFTIQKKTYSSTSHHIGCFHKYNKSKYVLNVGL